MLGEVKARLAAAGYGAVGVDVDSGVVTLKGETLNEKDRIAAEAIAGMKEAYARFFGTPGQPGRPARATVQVAGLVDEGQLVEIEAIAVRPHKAR